MLRPLVIDPDVVEPVALSGGGFTAFVQQVLHAVPDVDQLAAASE